MLSRKRTADALDANEAFVSTLRRNSVVKVAETDHGSIADLGLSAFQMVSQSLEGPFGLHAPTLFAALGALAGYAAKWAVSLDVADGLRDDDFYRQVGDGGRNVLYSGHVREILTGLSRQSVLSIILGAAARANARSFDRLEALTKTPVLPGPPNAMPDYPVEARFVPQFPPEALLMMLWENVSRSFRGERRRREDFALGLAYSAAHAMGAWRDRLAPETAAVLFMDSAMAMSKIDRAF